MYKQVTVLFTSSGGCHPSLFWDTAPAPDRHRGTPSAVLSPALTFQSTRWTLGTTQAGEQKPLCDSPAGGIRAYPQRGESSLQPPISAGHQTRSSSEVAYPGGHLHWGICPKQPSPHKGGKSNFPLLLKSWSALPSEASSSHFLPSLSCPQSLDCNLFMRCCLQLACSNIKSNPSLRHCFL